MLKPNFEKGDGLGIRFVLSVLKFSGILKILRYTQNILGILKSANLLPMPSPSAFSKFGSSVLNFFKHAQFFMYTQNHFAILKS